MFFYSKYSWELLNRLQRRLKGSRTWKLYYLSVIFNDHLPFSCTGSFCIELDLLGQKLQRFSDFRKKFNYAQISVLPQTNHTTIFSISALADQDEKAARDFVLSFVLQSKADLADCALRAAVCHSENTYFRPEFIQGLSEPEKKEVLQRFDDTTVSQVGQEKQKDQLSRPFSFRLDHTPLKISHNLNH
jgi:hypothetical protein